MADYTEEQVTQMHKQNMDESFARISAMANEKYFRKEQSRRADRHHTWMRWSVAIQVADVLAILFVAGVLVTS